MLKLLSRTRIYKSGSGLAGAVVTATIGAIILLALFSALKKK